MQISKSNDSQRPGFCVGLEHDHLAVRAARIEFKGDGRFSVVSLADATGDFSEEDELVNGLRMVKEKLRLGAKDRLVSCIAGKQVSATQFGFRKLPPEEMVQALRLELRKSIPFDVSGATLDYRILDDNEPRAENCQVLVAVASAGLVSRHLKLLDRAGMAPASVDVLPVSLANALWAWKGRPSSDNPICAIHIGPSIATIVIDGIASFFFNRYVPFAADEFAVVDDVQKSRSAGVLAEEVAKTLAFYEKSGANSGVREILLLGDFNEDGRLAQAIRKSTGLECNHMNLAKKLEFQESVGAGKFDLAISLAIRGAAE